MTYESLVTFPKVFRRLAAELKPKGPTGSDILAFLIARHWLEQRGERYVGMPLELSDAGAVKFKCAIRCPDPDDSKRQWLCKIIGVEGAPSRVAFHVPRLSPQYTHLWVWSIAPEESDEQYAHHWRGPVAELESWPMEPETGDRVLALKALLEQSPV